MEHSLNQQSHHTGQRISGLLRQRCPRCLAGAVFRGRVTMNDTCAVCGLRFGREEGYFSGSMDLSFFLAAPVLAFVFLVLYQVLSTTWSLIAILLASYVVFMPLVPPVFRYSRVLWLYIDWQLDPVYEPRPITPLPIVARAWLMPEPRRPWTHDSLFALTQRLATLIDPAFNRTLARRPIDLADEQVERAAWGTDRLGLLGERALPLPGEDQRRWQAFSAYGLLEDRAVIVSQEWPAPIGATPPRLIVQVRATPEVVSQIDWMLVETYAATALPDESIAP